MLKPCKMPIYGCWWGSGWDLGMRDEGPEGRRRCRSGGASMSGGGEEEQSQTLGVSTSLGTGLETCIFNKSSGDFWWSARFGDHRPPQLSRSLSPLKLDKSLLPHLPRGSLWNPWIFSLQLQSRIWRMAHYLVITKGVRIVNQIVPTNGLFFSMRVSKIL